MAPPPLPQDYGGGTGGGWNTGSSAVVTSAPPPVQDDDWGWKPQEQPTQNNSSAAAPRYGNVEDDLWSNNDAGNDANYNQVNLISCLFVAKVVNTPRLLPKHGFVFPNLADTY